MDYKSLLPSEKLSIKSFFVENKQIFVQILATGCSLSNRTFSDGLFKEKTIFGLAQENLGHTWLVFHF